MKHRSFLVPALLSALYFQGSLLAQEQPPPPVEESKPQEVEQPPSLGANEVLEQAEAARRDVQRILVSLADSEVLTDVAQRSQPTIDEIRDATNEVDESRLERLGFRQLERVQLDWVRYEAQVEDWLGELGKQAGLRQENSDRLAELRESLTATRDRLAGQEGVLPAVERTDAVLAEIDEVESQVRERLEGLLALQGRLVDAQAMINGVMARIDEANRVARLRLLTLDSRPLWVALSHGAEGPTVAGSLAAAWRDSVGVAKRFLEEDRIGLVLHVVWFAALLIPMLYLRRRGRERMAGQPSLRRTAFILDRPASAAFVLATLIARWTYRPMPEAYIELLIFLILIPLIRLLVRVLPRTLHLPLYLFGLLFVIDQVQDLAGKSVGGRVLLLLVGLIALVVIPWMSRTGRLSAAELGRWASVLPVLAWAAWAAFVLSVVANVVGSVGLADLMSELVLGGIFASLLLYTGYLVIEGVVGLTLLSPAMRPLRSIAVHGEAIRVWLLRAAQFALVVWWVWAMLSISQLRGVVVNGLGNLLVTERSIGTVKLSLGNLVEGLLALWVAVVLSRVLRVVLEEDVMPRFTLPRGVPSTISMMARFAVITFGVLFAAAVAGFDLSQFAFVIGALGVGIGFGLQNVVSNFVSGLILIFERPIRVGDTVQTVTLLGEVRSIGIRSSRVRTFDGAEVIVPNGSLIAGEVTNWTLSDRLRRIELLVGVAYGTDVREVERTLLEVVKQHAKVLERPEPVALFQGFGESSLDFSLRYWTADYDRWMRISSEIAMAVNDALKEAGIEIPFPQRDLHVRSVDASVAGAVKGGR